MKKGRPVGKALKRLDITSVEFDSIVEYTLNNKDIKPQTKSNIIKTIYLLYFFGFRVGEVTLLTGKDINEAVFKKVINLTNKTKTGKPRNAYIDDIHIGVLEELFYLELEEDKRYYLIRPWGRPMSHYSPATLQRLVNDVIHKALDSTQYSTHSFRAGLISEMHQKGQTIKTIAEYIGHEKEATTMKYITVTENEKKKCSTLRTPLNPLSFFMKKIG